MAKGIAVLAWGLPVSFREALTLYRLVYRINSGLSRLFDQDPAQQVQWDSLVARGMPTHMPEPSRRLRSRQLLLAWVYAWLKETYPEVAELVRGYVDESSYEPTDAEVARWAPSSRFLWEDRWQQQPVGCTDRFVARCSGYLSLATLVLCPTDRAVLAVVVGLCVELIQQGYPGGWHRYQQLVLRVIMLDLSVNQPFENDWFWRYFAAWLASWEETCRTK